MASTANGLDVHGAALDDDVFDVDALMAERDDRPFRFRWAGETWQFPPRMDVRVVQAVDQGDVLGALEMLLGPEQWQQLVDVPEVLDAVTLKVVIDRYVEKQGLSVPNSARPSRSSPSVRGR